MLRQLAHDLDRLRVPREHHLALRAVDVVARVDLLRTLRRRCRRGPGSRRRLLGKGPPLRSQPLPEPAKAPRPRSWPQLVAAAHRTAAPECRASPCAWRGSGRGTSALRPTASSRSPGESECRSPPPAMPCRGIGIDGSVIHEFVTGSYASTLLNAPTRSLVVTSPPAT